MCSSMTRSNNNLYVHIPFCERKCFYCSFVVSIGQEKHFDQYLKMLESEASRVKGTRIDAVYLGGGTPTLLNEAQLRWLLWIIKENFMIEKNIEWSIEANPEGIDKAKLSVLKSGGVNRVSLGVQTFNDNYLKVLGRNHDARKAENTYYLIREAGFSNVSVDLMFGFPQQTSEELIEDLHTLIELKCEHVSLYSLTLEQNSRFYAQHLRLPPDGYVGELYTLIKDTLEASGFHQYEVSNFAKKDRACAHNINYWQGGNYIGLGIGAHSHLNGRRWWNISNLTDYIDKMSQGLPVEEGYEQLTDKERQLEKFLFGLRMNEGIDLSSLSDEILEGPRSEKFQTFVREGFLLREGSRVKASDKGRLVLDELSSQLI